MDQLATENDVIKLLKFDHKRVLDLLFHCEQSEAPMHKLSFAETALNQITIHSYIEEKIFYPFIVENMGGLAALVHSFERAHDQIDSIIKELASKSEFDSDYEEKFEQLAESLRDHISDEENDLFRELRGVDLSSLLPKIHEAKQSFVNKCTVHDGDFTPQNLLYKNNAA